MKDHRPKRMSALAAAVIGQALPAPTQLPTIQAGWAEYELMMRGRKWPETVIEVCRQAYFQGANRLHEIILSMPDNASIVGRVHQAIHTELRAFDQEMVATREARKADDKQGNHEQ